MAAYQVKDKSFATIDEYFDYMAETFGYTAYHRSFTSDTVDSDGLKLHLDIYEHDKNAPTIVLIPGTALYSLCYVEIMYKLGVHGFNFVGFDPRGHGRSEGTRGDYTIEEIMADAQNVITYAIDRFNPKVSLMGSSQGGIVAFYLAAIEERIQSVICQNFADLTDTDTMNLSRYPNLTKFIKPLLLGFGNGLFSDAQLPISMYLDLEKIKIKRFGNAKNFMDQDPLVLKSVSIKALRSLTKTPIPKNPSEISTPVMVFQGTDDTIFPVEYTQSIYDKLTCKKHFEIFENMNHALITDNVEEIVPPIVEWLKEIYPES
ncbi:MAG: hypothetical protein COA57_12425 [Flavobacteriales bacterium]|nr:alpha/beta fold hydrolase [Bacteroidales bacterium AH-315-I05]PCJ82970.1 MAG: hypothetical protein COA57_12425 [Flavobacteriales bacterium]